MNIFKLPDLGEGLAEAEIREWYVAEGDVVKTEQPLAAMETAKAVVDVPSPHSGRITKLYGKVGDIIKTGAPLVAFENNGTEKTAAKHDGGTVVGSLEVTNKVLKESATGIEITTSSASKIKASPAVRALAKKLNVNLETIKPTGPGGSITLDDLSQISAQTTSAALAESLHGARRSMAILMGKAHQEVVGITIVDDADVNHWQKQDFTVRMTRAIAAACQIEPALNAHFDGKSLSRELFKEVNLGLALDTVQGLYVPVLKNIQKCTDADLRKQIDKFKEQAQKQMFSPEDLKGATIVLSNFGTLAGRYANPIVVPPTVAIIGVGKARDEVVAVDGKPVVHRRLPLSLTFDHRAVTGGEAARFLAALIADIQK